MDIDPASLGAVPIHAVRLAGRGRTREAALPFTAMSLTRRALDSALLKRAESLGVSVCRGRNVQSLTQTTDAWCAQTSDGQAFTAASAMLATGKHDLRGHLRPSGIQNGLIAFKMYWRLQPMQAAALAGFVELTLYDGGYAGLQMVEGGIANLCCLIDTRAYRLLGGRWSDLLAAMCRQSPHLAVRLQDAEPLLKRPLAIAAIPYGMVRSATDTLWHLGDQAAVIASFTGDGISLALHTGVLAGVMRSKGASAQAFQRRVALETRRQVRLAARVSQLLVQCPRLASAAVTLWPGILRHLASHTRIEPHRLLA